MIEGHVYKLGISLGKWKRKYFVVEKGMLVQFEGEERGIPRRLVNLEECSVQSHGLKVKGKIVVELIRKRDVDVMTLGFDSEKECRKWVNAFKGEVRVEPIHLEESRDVIHHKERVEYKWLGGVAVSIVVCLLLYTSQSYLVLTLIVFWISIGFLPFKRTLKKVKSFHHSNSPKSIGEDTKRLLFDWIQSPVPSTFVRSSYLLDLDLEHAVSFLFKHDKSAVDPSCLQFGIYQRDWPSAMRVEYTMKRKKGIERFAAMRFVELVSASSALVVEMLLEEGTSQSVSGWLLEMKGSLQVKVTHVQSLSSNRLNVHQQQEKLVELSRRHRDAVDLMLFPEYNQNCLSNVRTALSENLWIDIDSRFGVSVAYKPQYNCSSIMTKTTMVLHTCAIDLVGILRQTNTFDYAVTSEQFVSEEDNVFHRVVSIGDIGQRDFCLQYSTFSSETMMDQYLLWESTDHTNCPPQPHIVRARLHFAGFHLKQIGDKVLLTFVEKIDFRCAIGTDLEAYASLKVDSFSVIRDLVQAKNGLSSIRLENVLTAVHANHGWETVSRKHIEVYRRFDHSNSAPWIKMVSYIPAPPILVSAVLLDPLRRNWFDALFDAKRSKILKTTKSTCIHQITFTSSIPCRHASRDFVLSQNSQLESDGSVTFELQSEKNDWGSVFEGTTRGTFEGSFLLERYDGSSKEMPRRSCRVTAVYRVDLRSADELWMASVAEKHIPESFQRLSKLFKR